MHNLRLQSVMPRPRLSALLICAALLLLSACGGTLRRIDNTFGGTFTDDRHATISPLMLTSGDSGKTISLAAPLHHHSATEYRWDFGGGTTVRNAVTTVPSIKVDPISVLSGSPQSFTVKVTVVVDSGEAHTYTATYQVQSAQDGPGGTDSSDIFPPQADVQVSQNVFYGGTAATVTAPVTLRGGRSILQAQWDFSAAMAQEHYVTSGATGAAITPVHVTTATPGLLTLIITTSRGEINDGLNGHPAPYTFPYTVQPADLSPEAVFPDDAKVTYDPHAVASGEQKTFELKIPFASGSIVDEYDWDFGDGAAPKTLTTADHKATVTAAAAGTYTLKVTVYAHNALKSESHIYTLPYLVTAPTSASWYPADILITPLVLHSGADNTLTAGVVTYNNRTLSSIKWKFEAGTEFSEYTSSGASILTQTVKALALSAPLANQTLTVTLTNDLGDTHSYTKNYDVILPQPPAQPNWYPETVTLDSLILHSGATATLTVDPAIQLANGRSLAAVDWKFSAGTVQPLYITSGSSVSVTAQTLLQPVDGTLTLTLHSNFGETHDYSLAYVVLAP